MITGLVVLGYITVSVLLVAGVVIFVQTVLNILNRRNDNQETAYDEPTNAAVRAGSADRKKLPVVVQALLWTTVFPIGLFVMLSCGGCFGVYWFTVYESATAEEKEEETRLNRAGVENELGSIVRKVRTTDPRWQQLSSSWRGVWNPARQRVLPTGVSVSQLNFTTQPDPYSVVTCLFINATDSAHNSVEIGPDEGYRFYTEAALQYPTDLDLKGDGREQRCTILGGDILCLGWDARKGPPPNQNLNVSLRTGLVEVTSSGGARMYDGRDSHILTNLPVIQLHMENAPPDQVLALGDLQLSDGTQPKIEVVVYRPDGKPLPTGPSLMDVNVGNGPQFVNGPKFVAQQASGPIEIKHGVRGVSVSVLVSISYEWRDH